MRKHILIIATILLLFCCFTRCKKDDISLSNIVLYNQPLETIQKYIQGKWKIVYGKGGISSNEIQYCKDCSVEFTSTNKIISNSFAITAGAVTIQWTKEKEHILMEKILIQ